ncbi:hypothetical protein [Streptomyces sp. 7N604]|uniref:hypothetical protein n=1 Tax=Streptomyces sp. 7N604 TaxID=3457415 RepID=UPI003FCF517A
MHDRDRRGFLALVLALLAAFCCTAAGSPVHVHTLPHGHAPSYGHTHEHEHEYEDGPRDDDSADVDIPADPAPHQPGDHCSREPSQPSWEHAGHRTVLNPATLPAPVADVSASPEAGLGSGQLAFVSGAPITAGQSAQSHLCLWRI